MKRKIGDVYRVALSDEKFAYMQHICNDLTQLSSAVVFVLRTKFEPNEEIKFEKVADVQTGFFAHVFPKAGEVLKVWEPVSWSQPVLDSNQVTWSIFNLDDIKLERTTRWCVWETDKEMRGPVSRKELMNSELGLVMSPEQIISRIETGQYKTNYPAKVY